MNWLENKYILLASSRLRNFRTRNGNYNFSCPICSDSKKNKRKARGWILKGKGASRFYCHNCGASLKFDKFLKRVDLTLYYDFIKETITEGKPQEIIVPRNKTRERLGAKPKINLKKISQLDPSHHAKQYIQSRLIPSSFHYKLFYAPKFKAWVNGLLPDKFESLEHDEPRLIIPFFDEDGEFFGFQGRSFKANSYNKYITILLDDEKPKLFGLEALDKNKRVYVFEGPIDAMFIPNSIACCGGKLDYNGLCTIIYDNEARSRFTIKKIKNAIADGHSVCIWPDNIKEKDINEMIINGFTIDEIKTIIDSNTFTGLAAELRLAAWNRT